MQDVLLEVIETIENEDIKDFAKELVKHIPDYWFHVPASSTGKYHPSYALGDGGLMRHTCALIRFLNHTFAVDCMNDFTSRERDLLRVAGLVHDSMKSGTQDEYEQNKYTKFDHPLLAANFVRKFDGKYLSHDEIECIANAIESHMGQWNTDKRSDVILPLPKNKFQKMLHWADYMASRKDINVLFAKDQESKESSNPQTWTFPFGKYKGMTFESVKDVDQPYLIWLRDKADFEKREPLKTFLAAL